MAILAERRVVSAATASVAEHAARGTQIGDKRVISGIVHVLQSGCRWIDAPTIFGPPKTLYNSNVRWAAKSVWRNVIETLAATGGPPCQRADRQHACFATLKTVDASPPRYDKFAANFLCNIHLAAAIKWWL